LKSVESRQLMFAFADSPAGGGNEEPDDVSLGKTYLLHQAEVKEATDPTARATDSDRLLERVASTGNLSRALLNVARNQGAAGVDGKSVREILAAAPKLLPTLQRELLSGKYLPGDIRRVWIPKPGGGQRGLGIPNVVDRWVQQAVLQVLEPIFEPAFHNSSHGFRRQRGAATAIAEAKRYLSEGYSITVDIDLSKFFDRVHHQRLLSRLAGRIADGRILKLVHRMLKAHVVLPEGTRVTTEQGAPQGGPLSPLLSNIVLDELDWELSRRGHRFVRYADDFSVFVRSARAGRRVMASLGRFIASRLRLVVNEAKSSVSQAYDLTFLGFRLGRNPQGAITVDVSSRTKQRLDRRIREMTPRTWGQSVTACMEGLSGYLRGWFGYFRICTEEGLRSFSRIDAHIRRRVRVIIMCHRKRRRHLYRHLLSRDVPPGAAAKTAFSRRGLWHRSISYGLHRAYPNDWFSQRMFNLRNAWQDLNAPPERAFEQLTLF
jgi:group II intron reverse transcriptase/maturase